MNRQAILVCVFGLLACGAVQLTASNSKQALTLAPSGPYHVAGNQIIDSQGRRYLMRGTQLPEFRLETIDHDNRAGEDFGPHSLTSLSAIRLRFNMNTVRLPLNIAGASGPGYFSELAKVVRRANDIDLLVVLAASGPGAADFWTRCSSQFKDYPNVMFDVDSADLVQAIRSAGAKQPVIVNADSRSDDANVIYKVSPQYAATRTEAERDVQVGVLASRVPVMANGMDLNIADEAACDAIPSDPEAASKLVRENLRYFDDHQVSWTISTFEPGKLIKDLSYHDATTLENGWTCGKAVYPYAGLGRVVEGHLRSSEERGLFAVSSSGGLQLSRGGFALAYGPVMAAVDAKSTGRPPASLGRISVQVTDALGATRPAGVLWASAGWGQVNFVVPKESAIGPARMTIVREDGSSLSANITIADTAPGFVTGHSCRGPAIGSATQVSTGGRRVTSALSACKEGECQTLLVPLTQGAKTTVRLDSSGFRNVRSTKQVEVTIAGVRVPVVSLAPADQRGLDHVTIEIPASLRGVGETDLVARVDGVVSNAVRIRFPNSVQ